MDSDYATSGWIIQSENPAQMVDIVSGDSFGCRDPFGLTDDRNEA